ncbi:hypothetical protein GDO81_013905 [Engystomops pustulosus]|uniref:Uncharacterized protein n=1 Tax=Engystomops pustulosus TaxID=76066 RepID=A0AAV7B6K9_ENGPU|nr:hypothetical protein GDO81_013905 [Engystomops pustulosus]
MPTASTMIEQDTTSYISMRSSVTLASGSAVTAQDTASYTSMRSCMMRQQTTSDMSMESMLTEQDTTSSVTQQETISDMPTGSTMIEQDSTSYISMRSSVTGQVTPSWLQDKCKDICTDCKCITNKDLFSHETQITTSDSGIWSMSRDLHSDCSYLYTNDEKIERKHLHSNCSEIYTSGGQTVSSQSDSECSDIYTSGNGFYSGLAESSEEKVLHSQAPSIDSHALYSDIYTNISRQDSATCPQEQQHLLNQ